MRISDCSSDVCSSYLWPVLILDNIKINFAACFHHALTRIEPGREPQAGGCIQPGPGPIRKGNLITASPRSPDHIETFFSPGIVGFNIGVCLINKSAILSLDNFRVWLISNKSPGDIFKPNCTTITQGSYRSEERRVGNERVMTCRARWPRYKKK